MEYKAIIHFVGGGELTLDHLSITGDNNTERLGELIKKMEFNNSATGICSISYTDVAYIFQKENITYIEMKEIKNDD